MIWFPGPPMSHVLVRKLAKRKSQKFHRQAKPQRKIEYPKQKKLHRHRRLLRRIFQLNN